ncbi:MAG: hypothetical protein N2561_01690 [Bacteroidetes bacterium]|nr:hypothetical protein [Rhodothermia bacterium]MCX7906236.1 hypothetical protein [Bacteroidota bacterium]MDW8286417.1 hypothetical protein [Bacteroidota bacterium]
MKRALLGALGVLGGALVVWAQEAGPIRVLEVHSEAYVQRGFEEAFIPLESGVRLSRLDAIATGPQGRIVLDIEGRRLSLPPLAMLDLAAARDVEPRAVLVGLERLRSRRLPSPQPVRLSRTALTRGSEAESFPPSFSFDPLERAERRWRGLEALAEAGFWGSFVLEAKRLLEEVPELGERPERRLAVVAAMARVGLSGEAAQEFRSVLEAFGSTHRELLERFLRQYGESLRLR